MNEELETLLQFFKVLADETRLRILGILAEDSRSVEELATMLNLKPPTVSHHLARLKQLDLVLMTPEGTTHVYALNPGALNRLSKDLLTPTRLVALVDDFDGDAWERKVLRDFTDGTQLKQIPVGKRKLQVILRWLVSQFEPDIRYRESEVNEIIKRYHPDFATLRRMLVGYGFMMRERGIYWRLSD